MSLDGRFVVFHEVVQSMARNLMLLDLDPPHAARPLLATAAEERNGVISPDGRWLAYESDESGRFEIYVRPFPAVDSGQWQVSTTSGTQPLWSRDGSELFFFDGAGALQSVRVAPRGPAWSGESPKTVLPSGYYRGDNNWLRSYDVSPDGRRFLMIKDSPTSQPSLVLVQHWTEDLKRLVPKN
jgi:serine/threonine-protein kinase